MRGTFWKIRLIQIQVYPVLSEILCVLCALYITDNKPIVVIGGAFYLKNKISAQRGEGGDQ